MKKIAFVLLAMVMLIAVPCLAFDGFQGHEGQIPFCQDSKTGKLRIAPVKDIDKTSNQNYEPVCKTTETLIWGNPAIGISRAVAGTMLGDGTVAAGTGFSLYATAGCGLGDGYCLYHVTFDTCFAGTPTCTASYFGDAMQNDPGIMGVQGADGCSVYILTSTTNPGISLPTRPFSFICVLP